MCARCVCARENSSVCMMRVFRWVGGWVLLVYGWVGGINTLEFARAHNHEWGGVCALIIHIFVHVGWSVVCTVNQLIN